ncbi:MAG: hypothetical protein JOZ14_05000 [Acidobacteria bacterium]|nr:hypothetical protein [Acidobacteriota bacterium]
MIATLIQRRRGTRIRAQIPLRLTSLDPASTFSENCHTLLVNQNGCGVRFNRPLKPGLRLRIDGLPGGGSATARVTTNIHPRPGSRYWTIGIGFDSPGNIWCLAPAPPDWTSGASLPRTSRTGSTLAGLEDNHEHSRDKQQRKRRKFLSSF